MLTNASTYFSFEQLQACASVRTRSWLMARSPCSMFESLDRSTPRRRAADSADTPAAVRIFRTSLPSRLCRSVGDVRSAMPVLPWLSPG